MKMESARFYASCLHPGEIKAPDYPEFAFIGRSNAGKSSLINFLLGKPLAKTSATPGKTFLLNYFLVNESFFFVDLPGYGFARRSQTDRKKMSERISRYLKESSRLRCLFILMDSRHPFTDADVNFIVPVCSQKIPFSLVFTKTDKLNQKERYWLEKRVASTISQWFEEPPNIFFTSVIKQKGKKELLDMMEFILKGK